MLPTRSSRSLMHLTIRQALVGLVLCAGASVVACGRGGDSGNTQGTTEPTPQPTPTPTIGLTSTTTSLTLNAGATQSMSVTVSRGGGYTGAVDVLAEGVPSGVSVVFGSVGSGTSVTVTATVRADTLATPGTYTVTTRATGSGVSAVTATVALTVMPRPNVTASASASSLSIVQGTRGTATVVLRRTNMTDSVAVSLGALPTNVTGTATPARIAGDTTIVAYDVGASAVPGTYATNIVLTATTGTVTTPITIPISLTVVAAPSYTMSLSPSSVSVVRGSSATTTLAIARTNFTDAVTLNATGMPTGMTVSFAPAAPTGNSSTITVNTTTALAAGSYAIAINGVGTAGNRTVTLTVTVLAPSLALSVTPTSFTTGAGSVLAASATLVRTNMTAPVTIVLAPTTGFTIETNPATLTGDAASIAITVAGSVAPGSYTLSLRAADAATGTAVVSAPASVTVQVSAPTGPIVFDYTGCTASSIKPLFVAFQDGPSAPWVVVPNVGDRYTVNPTQSRVGFAYVWSTLFHHHVIRLLTREELAAQSGLQCAPDVSTSVLRFQPTTSAIYYGSFSSAYALGLFSGAATVNAPRHIGLLAALWVTPSAERVTLQRDYDARFSPSNSTTSVPIDYNTAVPVTTANVAITNLGGRALDFREQGFYSIRQEWRPDLRAYGAVCGKNSLYPVVSDTTSVFKSYTVPTSAMRSTDAQSITARTVTGDFGTDGYHEEMASVLYRTVAPTSIRMPDPMIVPQTTIVSTAPFRVRAQFDMPAAGAFATLSQANGSQTVSLAATPGWMLSARADLTMPSFRGLAGYTDSWMFDGAAGRYTVTTSFSTFTADQMCSSSAGGTSITLLYQAIARVTSPIVSGQRKGK